MTTIVIPSFPEGRVRRGRLVRAFTLVELLISITVLVVLMLVVTQVVGIVQRTWVRANSRVSQFREARVAFDTLSRTISQATLNTYWENEFDEVRTDAAKQKITRAKNYVRQSELQFVCGPTPSLLPSAGSNAQNYPGHGVFFQAPLGITNVGNTDSEATSYAYTQNMVNLLCGRGYFVEWGDDAPYRPPFLQNLDTVPTRNRMRLMEYSPTAEMNRIYDPALRPVSAHSKQWFGDALTRAVTNTETLNNLSFTRPIADNILALVISPQTESNAGGGGAPTAIAPSYSYDSAVVFSPGGGYGPQGTQHLLPPLLKVTMVALDERAGERLSSDTELVQTILSTCGGLFKTAAQFEADLEGTAEQPGILKALLMEKKLNFRIFTTTIALKQSRWSL